MHNKAYTAKLLAGAALVANLGMVATAHAQDQDASSGVGINEIIVTAQKREQSIQDVPIAVTALGADALAVNRVERVTDLTGLAPGLIARQAPGASGSPIISMRGVSANASVPSQDRQISMYVDGVYIGGNRGAIFDLPDLERIEVLRGPQGTLFGRNATAGAINIVTRNPSGELAIRQDVTVGNQDIFRTRTTIDTPQFGPFSAYATYVHDEKRGDVRNLGAGTCFDRASPFNNRSVGCSPKYLGSKNGENVFAALRFDNGGALTATYKFDWYTNTNTPDVRTVNVINPNDRVGSMLLAVLAAQPVGGGAYGPTGLNPGNQRPDAFNNGWSQQGWQRGQGHNLTLDWEASDSLSFKNVTSYRKTRVLATSTVAGLDGLVLTSGAVAPYVNFAAPSRLAALDHKPTDAGYSALLAGTISSMTQAFNQRLGDYFVGYSGGSVGRSSQISNELQANYTSDFVTVTAGLLYYEGKENSDSHAGFRTNFSFMPVAKALPLGDVSYIYNKSVSMAAYTQAEFNITPELGLVVGGRLTRDKKTGYAETGGTFDVATGEIVGTKLQPYVFKKTKPSYSVGLNYKPNSDVLLYGKYSTAFLSGGAVADIIFPPETVKSWEAGLKADLFDRMVRFNLTGWLADYNNAQSANSGTCCNRPDIAIVVLSNGKLKAKGIEAELNIVPLRGLSFGGSVGYTTTSQSGTDPILAQGRPTKQMNMPRIAGTANVTYISQPLFGDATLLFRMDANFQSKMRSYSYLDVATKNPSFAPYEFTKGRTVLNGRLALRDIDMDGGAKLEVGLWAKNLLDNKDALYSFAFSEILTGSSYQPARTYGLDVIVRFNP